MKKKRRYTRHPQVAIPRPTDIQLREMLLDKLREDAGEYLIYAGVGDDESEGMRKEAAEATGRFKTTLAALATLGKHDAVTLDTLTDLWDRWDATMKAINPPTPRRGRRAKQ